MLLLLLPIKWLAACCRRGRNAAAAPGTLLRRGAGCRLPRPWGKEAAAPQPKGSGLG